MCIALIGGMDRLERHYRDEAAKMGVDLRVFSTWETNISAKLKSVDAMVIFTNKVSHQVRQAAVKTARSKAIPLIMNHSCGLCSLKECLGCLQLAEPTVS
jgi:hypothetical protein